MKKNLPIILLAAVASSITFSACQADDKAESKKVESTSKTPVEVPMKDGKAYAYFASGCFWCVEAVYESVKGVEESISGYSGGHTKNPTYEASNTGKTGHAEAVEIIYDPNVVSLLILIRIN